MIRPTACPSNGWGPTVSHPTGWGPTGWGPTGWGNAAALLLAALSAAPRAQAQGIQVDFSGYSKDCGIEAYQLGRLVEVRWPAGEGRTGHAVLRLEADRPLIARLALSAGGAGAPAREDPRPLLEEVDPALFITAGTREAPAGRPLDMPIWNVFFDKPANRPHQAHAARMELRSGRAFSIARRFTVALGRLSIGPFAGEWQFTFYTGSPLVFVEAVVSTAEDRRAILYDAGLLGTAATWKNIAWLDPEGKWQGAPAAAKTPDRAAAVRHRAIFAASELGTVACFPPPHQYQFPRDWTDNFKFTWLGENHAGLEPRFGFGIRQDPEGGGAFVPWFNAPPGTMQRLGVFYLLSRSPPEKALEEVLRYTNGDSFQPLEGHITFTSHWHMAVAVTAMDKLKQLGAAEFARWKPEFVKIFKDLGVQMVHLADFHGDGHQNDTGPLRLPELEMLFSECRRLSDDGLLLIPGEEVSSFLGLEAPGRHPGHWMCLFPKPVYWTMKRGPAQPLVEEHPKLGSIYHVGGRADMMELLTREEGLAWTAHPRIKASSWTPDIFRGEDFYLADSWLGAAWKAMPADLSRERLGERCLNLLDDMASWGQKKYLPGEVDVFRIDHTHELYAHMNVNYIRLERLPRFEEGWQPVLDALHNGQFFVTTGEVMILRFTAGGKESGRTLDIPSGGEIDVEAELRWTFPMRFAEIISGDGKRVYRERIELADTEAFGTRVLKKKMPLRGRKWLRFEAWDVAANGAFTQPVWLR